MQEKIVIISDLHAHYVNWDYLRHLVENHAENTDRLVVGGDIYDGFGISRYARGNFLPLLREHEEVIKIFDYLSEHFPQIDVIGGNHDFRWERNVVSQIPMEARPFAGEPLLVRACRRDIWDQKEGEWIRGNGYPNINLIMYDKKVSWFWEYKGILVAHAERFQKKPGGVGEETIKFFRRKLGINPKVVVNNHTHRLYMLYYPDVILIESGCMCNEAEYADMNPSLKYSEQMNGYVVVTLEDDKVSTQYTYLECLSDLRKV